MIFAGVREFLLQCNVFSRIVRVNVSVEIREEFVWRLTFVEGLDPGRALQGPREVFCSS